MIRREPKTAVDRLLNNLYERALDRSWHREIAYRRALSAVEAHMPSDALQGDLAKAAKTTDRLQSAMKAYGRSLEELELLGQNRLIRYGARRLVQWMRFSD